MRKMHLLDTNKSCLTSKEIEQFRQEITNQDNSPICKDISTMGLSTIGVNSMKTDNFCLVKEQLDV